MSTDANSPWSPDSNGKGIDFQELIRLARSGDEQALGILVNQCRDYLLLIANEELDQNLQGKFGASDFVQETMLIAHKKFDQFRGQSPAELKGWLRQILRNDLNRARRQFVDAHRRDIKRERTMDDSQLQPLPLADDSNTPRTDAMVQEEARLLREAMAQLPENYRLAVQLREWDELSFPEIGMRMSISEEAARKLCRRAMDKLEQLLKPIMRPDDSSLLMDQLGHVGKDRT
jgi:RNA polymerase sigma-70 factor (ECF subfamily)